MKLTFLFYWNSR